MATDLVSEIADVVGPTIAARVASSLGLDQASVQKAVSAAVPGLLASLVSLVSKPQGPTKLSDAVAKQQPGVLSSLVSVIGESGQKALIDKGTTALNSLLGGNTASALTNAVAQYADTGTGTKSLIGLLGPVVLGVLGQQQRSSGLDASGLARLLTSQKDTILAALPSGFSKYLRETGILDDLTPATTKFASPMPYQSSPSVWPWLLGALALIAIGALAWNLLSGRHRQVVETTPPKVEAPLAKETGPTSEAAPSVDLLNKLRGIKVGDVDIGDLATSAVNGLQTSLKSVTDTTSAQAASPELSKDASQFDQLTALLNQLSPENRKLLTDIFVAFRPQLGQLIDKALSIPSVGDLIKPTVDAIRANLDKLATT
jgi:Bacterial protein of unknown function (DUF937)